MLCDICHKNIATIHLTEIVNGKVVEVHICEKCAKLKTEALKTQIDITDLLGGLINKEDASGKEFVSISCPVCGLKYKEFKEKSRFGCANCYLAFKDKILPFLRKIHGSVRHIGKLPVSLKGKISKDLRIKELTDRLQRAIKLEEYEDAAHLRDEINMLKREDENIPKDKYV